MVCGLLIDRPGVVITITAIITLETINRTPPYPLSVGEFPTHQYVPQCLGVFFGASALEIAHDAPRDADGQRVEVEAATEGGKGRDGKG